LLSFNPYSMFSRLLVLIFCLISLHAFPADKVQIKTAPSWLYKVTPDLSRKPLSKQITGGYYYPLFERQVNLQTQTDYSHIIRHIENENGVQNASEVSVTFSPEFQQLIFHQLTLWRNGKVVSEVRPSQIKVVQEETDVDEFQYNGLKRAFVILKDVRKGDRIEYAYSVVGFNPVFENRYADKIYFGFETPICNYFETLIVPQGHNIYINTFNNAPKPLEEQNGPLRIYHWNNPSMKSWETQTGTPAWYESAPYVTISEYKTWQDVIQWGVKLFNNYRYELPAGLKNKISEWKKTAKGDQDVFVSQAIHFVQDQVRYLGMEIGTYTHQPHPPAEVYHQLFGDCKDKALLLATILQQENIPAYVALVNTSTRSRLVDVHPSTQAFDHAIVAIERSDYMFIDPTMSCQRGELVNMYVPAYGYALVLRDKESTLKRVEPGFLNSTTVREKIEVSYDDSSRFAVHTVYAGGSADRFRSSIAESGISEMEESFLKFYEKVYDGITQVDQLVINDDSVKNEMEVEENYSIPTLAQTEEDGKQKFEVFAKLLYDQLPDPGTVLKNAPLALQFPMSMQYTIQLHMPVITTLDLKEIHIKNDSYQFDFDPVANGEKILLQYSIRTFKDHVPASEIKKYKADYKKILEVLDIEFTNTGAAAGMGTYENTTGKVNINWSLVLFALLLVGALGFGLKKLNNYTVDVPFQAGTGWPIGGWLVVLGISLGLTAVFRLINFTTNDYFNHAAWQALGGKSGALLKFTWAAELAFSLSWLCGSIGLLYWFMNRRDIFPRMFLWYIGTMIGGQLLLLILYNLAASSNTDIISTAAYDFARTLVYSVIWGVYILRSERVKSTFLETAG
jgi:hypothetical protein